MPTKFIELTRIEDNEKILINVDHISKFYSSVDNTTHIWIDGGYIIVKESYEKIRHLLIHGLMSKYVSVILNNDMEDDE
jgi:uncharacterized protein YlzI (FlbEa/FlbD family)